MSQKQPKRGRLWLSEGSCIRLRPLRRNHVWSYDFAMVRTVEGRALRILVIIDEFTRECLKLVVARRLRSQDVLDALWSLFATRGIPEHIRSDNGPEFAAKAVRGWLARLVSRLRNHDRSVTMISREFLDLVVNMTFGT